MDRKDAMALRGPAAPGRWAHGHRTAPLKSRPSHRDGRNPQGTRSSDLRARKEMDRRRIGNLDPESHSRTYPTDSRLARDRDLAGTATRCASAEHDNTADRAIG